VEARHHQPRSRARRRCGPLPSALCRCLRPVSRFTQTYLAGEALQQHHLTAVVCSEASALRPRPGMFTGPDFPPGPGAAARFAELGQPPSTPFAKLPQSAGRRTKVETAHEGQLQAKLNQPCDPLGFLTSWSLPARYHVARDLPATVRSRTEDAAR